MPSSHQPDIHPLVTDAPGSENQTGQPEPQAHLHRVRPRASQKKGWIAAAVAFLLVFTALTVGSILLGKWQKADLDEELSSLRQSQKDTQERLTLAQAAERQSHHQSLLDRLERLRLGSHSITWNAAKSWSDQTWELAGQAAAIGIDDHLRNQTAATLIGLDARIIKRFREMAASAVLFDAEDERLLIGGVPAHQNYPAEGAKVWDSRVILHVSPHKEPGPVAFGPERLPVQLVVQDGPSLLLWNVAKQTPVTEYHFNTEQDRVVRWALNSHAYPLLAMTADGTLVAAAGITADDKRVIAVWEGWSGKRLFQISAPATALAFSSQGEYLATGDDQGKITLWPIRQGELTSIPASRLAIRNLAFSTDSRRLAVSDAGGRINIWKLGEKLPPVSLPGSSDDGFALAFSPDGTLLATGGRSSTKLWDAATGRMLLEIGCEDVITGLAFSNDGHSLAVSSRCQFSQGGVSIWNLDYGRGTQTLRGLSVPASRLCFSPDGRFLAALALDGPAAIWNLETGRLVRIVDVPQRTMGSAGLAFSPDSKRFIHSAGRRAKSWEVATGKELGDWELPNGSMDTVLFHGATGKLLLFRMETKNERPICVIRNLIEPNIMESVADIKELQTTDAKSPLDGSYLVIEAKATAQGDNADKERRLIQAFDPLTGRKVWPLAGVERIEGNHLCIDPTGKAFAFQAVDKKIKLVEMPGGKVFDFPDRDLTALGPAGQLWLEPRREENQPFGLSLFRSGNRTPLVTLGIDYPGTSASVQFNLAGTHVAWTNPDGTVTLCDLESLRKKLAELGLGW